MPAKWNYPTPTGFIYTMPRSVAEIKHQEVNCAQASIEKWDDLEVPPDPTWEMVAILLDEIDRVGIVLDNIEDAFTGTRVKLEPLLGLTDYYEGGLAAIAMARELMDKMDDDPTVSPEPDPW